MPAGCGTELTFIQVFASLQIQLVTDGVGAVVGQLVPTHVCIEGSIQLHLFSIVLLKFLQHAQG